MRISNKADTLKVLLEIAAGLNELSSDPKALKKAIKESNELTDAEKLERKKAEQIIANSVSVYNDLESRKKAVGDLEGDKAKLEAAETAFMQVVADHDKERAKLVKEQEKLALNLAQLAKDSEVQALREVSLNAREASLNGREEVVAAAEEEARKRIQQASAIMAG